MEFDVLMQYYSKLRDHMRLIDADKLYDWFVSTEIITWDPIKIYKDAFMAYGPEIILTKMACYLLSGKVCILHIMFETLQNNDDNFHTLVLEIQAQLNQKLLTSK